MDSHVDAGSLALTPPPVSHETQVSHCRSARSPGFGNRVAFDVRGFHDVLGAGSLPLDVLERRIDAWIARQPR